MNNISQNIVIYKSNYWNRYQGTIIPLLPPNAEIQIEKNELLILINKYKPFFIRWTSGWDLQYSTPFWFVIKDSKEDLSIYNSKIRNTIKKGINRCYTKIISKDELKQTGYKVYINAFKSYSSSEKPMTIKEFIFQIDNLYLIGEWQFWGLYLKENSMMIGYTINWIYNKTCEYKIIKFDPEFLKESGGYLIIHEMNKYYLNECEYLYVNDGARSLSHDSNIQSFLEKKFGFRKSYCNLHICYRKPIKIIVDILYPFRNLIFSINTKIFRKLSIVLRHEEIARVNRIKKD